MIRTSFNEAWFVRRDGLVATTGPVVLPYDAMLRDGSTST